MIGNNDELIRVNECFSGLRAIHKNKLNNFEALAAISSSSFCQRLNANALDKAQTPKNKRTNEPTTEPTTEPIQNKKSSQLNSIHI